MRLWHFWTRVRKPDTLGAMVDEEPKAEPAAPPSAEEPAPAPAEASAEAEEKPENADAAAPAAPEAEKPDKVREWGLAVGLMFTLALVFWTLLRYLRSAMGP